jgi:hypothetical protein
LRYAAIDARGADVAGLARKYDEESLPAATTLGLGKAEVKSAVEIILFK